MRPGTSITRAATATADQAEGFALDHAWRELSPEAFGFWLRLMIEPRSSLEMGIKPLARYLGMHHQALRNRMTELRNKGYIRLRLTGPRQPTKIILTRRAMLVGPTSFIRL